MKIKALQIVCVIITSFCAAQKASCQTNTNGLVISAKGSILASANSPQLFLTVHLLNASSNDITVLTKNLSLSFDTSDATKCICTLGYNDPAPTYQGHPIIASLYDFSPVTLRPNEEAMFTKLEDDSMMLKDIKKDAQITVCYAISKEWGSRFSTWSGSVCAKPFVPTVKEPR
jgi:hypothetical protein